MRIILIQEHSETRDRRAAVLRLTNYVDIAPTLELAVCLCGVVQFDYAVVDSGVADIEGTNVSEIVRRCRVKTVVFVDKDAGRVDGPPNGWPTWANSVRSPDDACP